MSDTQYADDLFPEKEQFADDLFPASVDTENARKKLGSSPIQDYIFSRDKVSAARVLNHFKQGFSDGWGHDGMTVTKEAADYMRKSGWFGDYEDGQVTLTKAANEALFRPAAIALFGTVEGGFRLMSGAFRGVQETVAGTLSDVGQPRLGRELAAVPEAFPHPRPIAGSFGLPQMPTRTGLAATPAGIAESGEALLLRARAAKIIGHGEEGWRGTAPEIRATPEQTFRGYLDSDDAAMFDRGSPVAPVEAVTPIGEGLSSPAGGFDLSGQPRFDVGTVARGIAPDLFYRYDDAQARRDTFSSQLAELNDMRARDAAQATEIEGLKAKLQERVKEAETEAREMAPAVREAYVEAKKTVPDESARSVLPDEPAAVETAPARLSESARPIEEQRAFIQRDMTERLVAAGRPQSEAQAAAAIDAAYWETRAARFEGRKGTAEEMYRRESPEILGPGMQSDFRTYTKPKLKNVSLGQFLSHIGIRDNDPMISDVRAITGRNNKYIRKDGMPLDRAREAAAEQGYIPKDSTIRTLLNAMDKEERGTKVYPIGDEPPAKLNRDSHLGAIEKALDDGLREVGLDPAQVSKDVHSRAIKIMDKEGVSDPIAAYERAEGEVGLFQREKARTDTPEFKKWFGESKVVDEAGEPVVVYHGTDKNFQAFNLKKATQGIVWFTSDRAVIEAGNVGAQGRGRVIEMYASVKNPAGWPEYEKLSLGELRGRGYDGVILRDADGTFTGIAFEPTQLKDVRNSGAFDPSNPKLLTQDGDIKRGRIRLREDGRNTIHLLKDANASTFIHEKGHDYLARMIRDAADPDAPVQLRTDTESVYRWLGVDKPSEIKTRHHEKFARGFENYIMEGRAPSQGLARVFEQFRQWLLRIYTEATRLKAPLNDEIRGVFDRMLAVNPEDVVIAADRAPEQMARRHEGLADAPVPEARDLAGNIQSERDRIASGLQSGDQDARLAEITAGIEGRTSGSAEFGGDRNAPAPSAGGSGASPELGTVGEGGSQVAPEIPGLGSATASVKPTRPHDSFGPSTDVADKAGNIRLDLLKAPDDVKAIISQVADENAGFQSVRGPVSDVQVAELAEAMGIDAQYLSTRKMGEAWTAPQIVALRNLLIHSATEVRDLMRKAANGGENELMAYAEAKARHMMIQERVSSVTAEAGRALRAFQRRFSKGMDDARSLGEFLKKDTGQTLFQLQREVQLGMSLESPAQVSKFINDTKKSTISEMVQETWINALLSGPITHVKNIVGNTVVAVLGVADTATAAGIGKVRAILGNDAERVRMGEVQANLFGLVQGAQDGIIAAKYAFLHEEQYTRAQTIEQAKFQAVPSKRIVLKTYEQGSPEYNKRLDSISNARARAERLTGEALTRRVEELKSNPTPDMVLEASERAVEIGGKQIRTPGRLLTAEDEFFKTVAYRQKLNELAYRQATNDGLSGDAFNTRLAQLTMNPPDEMMMAASKHADYQTFTNALGKTGAAIQQFSNSHLLAKMIVPFVRTPLNLLKYANERTPMGVFSREVRANLSGVNGKIAQDTQIARMAIGTSLGITAIAMAGQDMITGGGPSDRNERAALMLSGWRPYSVKIGEFYYSFGWVDPFSTIMGISADMAEASKMLGEDGDEEMNKVATHLFASISKNVLSKSSLRGASDFLQAVTDPDRWGPRYLQNLAGTVVPSVVAQRARIDDEFQREARTTLDSIKSRIPGLRQDLLPRRDIWGEPIRSNESLGPNVISPIAMGKLTNDPATQALLDAELFPAKLGRKIRGVELTDQQYDDFSRVAGRMAKMRVNAIVSNPGFENAPVEIRSEILRKAITGSRDAARSMIMMQNPIIIKQALDSKMSAAGR